MSTYRKITILFADEEPAQAYADEALAQTVLERCEEWQHEYAELEDAYHEGKITVLEKREKLTSLVEKHPLKINEFAQDYALKTVFLHE